MFDFPVGETTIWNARQAAAAMLEFTMRQIIAVLKKSKFLGVDETYTAWQKSVAMSYMIVYAIA